jgi:energy-coupling factor transporter ATP-binding protein EcfA2
VEAEQALLGCVLLDPRLQAEVKERIERTEVFYDIRHQRIWEAMLGVTGGGKALDMITVGQALQDRSELQGVGGWEYLTSLMEAVPSAANWQEYAAIVLERWTARQAIVIGTNWASKCFEEGVASEAMLSAMEAEVKALAARASRGLAQKPVNLQCPKEFEEAYWARWFGGGDMEPGRGLPFEFPLRIRASEMTLFTGDNGSGKSSMLGQIAIVLGLQGARVCMASMEVPPEITCWIMARQLLGVGRLANDDGGHQQAAMALAWMESRLRLYSFLGIASWREVLGVFKYAAEHLKYDTFIVDSVGRLGIADDDYGEQGLAAARFADFCVKTGAHLFLVVHENKSSDGSAKNRVRGSKQWTDNSHNVVGTRRNEEKGQKVEELREQFRTGMIDENEYKERAGKLQQVWDAKFLLSKQRWPGSQQNGSRYLYFDRESLQFRERWDRGAVRYIGH